LWPRPRLLPGAGLFKFDKGEIGWLNTNNVVVTKVIDGQTVLLTFYSPRPGGQPPGKLPLLLVGTDTSSLADGKELHLRGFYYVTGNAKVGTVTAMRIVPVALTRDELVALGQRVPKDKK
jgi:hypothetical protein